MYMYNCTGSHVTSIHIVGVAMQLRSDNILRNWEGSVLAAAVVGSMAPVKTGLAKRNCSSAQTVPTLHIGHV